MSALSMQSEELEEQGRANSSALAWSIFSQNLEALEKLQASQEYQKEVTNIINNVLYDLPLAVGCGAISQKHSSKRALENFEIQDDNTNDLNQFRIDLDIAIHNTDKNKYVFKFLRYMDTFSKTLEKYADHDHLFVDTLFAKLSDHEVRIIIYKCITDEKYFERSEQIGFFNHFFAHSFRNPLHANKFFTAYEFDSGYLVKKN